VKKEKVKEQEAEEEEETEEVEETKGAKKLTKKHESSEPKTLNFWAGFLTGALVTSVLALGLVYRLRKSPSDLTAIMLHAENAYESTV